MKQAAKKRTDSSANQPKAAKVPRKRAAVIDLTKKKQGSKYTLAQKAETLAIAAASKSFNAAGKIAGVPHTTVSRWSNEAAQDSELAQVTQDKKDSLGEQIDGLIDGFVKSIGSDVANATVKDTISLCQLIDKKLLLEGKATSITQSLSNMPPAQQKARVLELVRKAA